MKIRQDLILVFVMISIIALMLIPLNQVVVDTLLAINLSLSIMLLMVSIYLKHPSDFATFPSVILIGTAFRLALSVSTTRLILSEAEAGQIIQTFGDFVVAGSVAIGLVIFLIVTCIQFLVVTKGAERVAEVSARFALDALPGKQMSIDADIRAGAVDAAVGIKQRKRLDKDSQFFGAMDGAMKFVKGDAIAGLIIIVINLIGGIAVGATVHGYSLGEAVSIYSLLTVGDGLVAQIPALLMAFSAGIIVTRSTNDDNFDLGTDITRELLSDFRVPGIASVVILGAGFVPGFPMPIFVFVSTAFFLISVSIKRKLKRKKEEEEASKVKNNDKAFSSEPINPRIMLALASSLYEALDVKTMTQKRDGIFRDLNASLGGKFRAFKIAKEPSLLDGAFSVILDEVPLLQSKAPVGCIYAMMQEEDLKLINCSKEEAKHVSNLNDSGYWIPKKYIQNMNNYKLNYQTSEEAICNMAYASYEKNLNTLFGLNELKELVDELAEEDQELAQEMEALQKDGRLIYIIRNLFKENVPIKPQTLFWESLRSVVQSSEDMPIDEIVVHMRISMKRQLCHYLSDENNILGAYLLSPDFEQTLRALVLPEQKEGVGSFDGKIVTEEERNEILLKFQELLSPQKKRNGQITLIAAPDIRRGLKIFLESNDMYINVIAPNEVSTDVRMHPLEVLQLGSSLSSIDGNSTPNAA